MFRTRRSISLTTSQPPNKIDINAVALPLHTKNSFETIVNTNDFNNQYNGFLAVLNEKRQDLQTKIPSLLFGDTSLRNNGVGLAWEYEQKEIEMGGKGSAGWTDSQRQEILANGRVRGAEGHHINSVKDHPSLQADPDNIKFMKDRQEHLSEHNGDFRTPTKGELIDKNERLRDVNNGRVMKNELMGIGLAAAIGLGVGFSIAAATTLAQRGVSPDSMKLAAVAGFKSGAEASSLAVVNHLFVLGIGEATANVLSQKATGLIGLAATENLLKICNMAVVGAISSIVFSTWVFVKMKWKGFSTSAAAKQTGKTLGTSLGILFISIAAQGIWGGYAGLIVSVSIGMMLVSAQYIKQHIDVKLLKGIRLYSIDKMKPAF